MHANARLHYVDWLRVFAFAILIVYHCSVAFFPDMTWLISSVEKSDALTLVMKFPRAWRLALLFFVSGMGTWFAFRANSGLGFLKERSIRLLIPLIFAMCVIVVPQVWYERMHENGYEGSFLTFWVTRYFTEGKYPDGNFTWAHMWFVAYLLVMTLFCYPVFRWVIDPRSRMVLVCFEKVARTPWIYLFFLLPLALNLALSPMFPRQTNSLYNDGAWFAVWASWFGLGFLIARHHQALIGGIMARRWVSVTFALALTVVLYCYSWADPLNAPLGDYETMTVAYKTALFALAWSMILTLVGFAARHLNRKSAALTWLNRKIFPLYIVHQTVILAALYHVLPLEAGLWTKFVLVLVATSVGSMVFAAACERLPSPLRALVGLPGDPPGASAAVKSATIRT